MAKKLEIEGRVDRNRFRDSVWEFNIATVFFPSLEMIDLSKAVFFHSCLKLPDGSSATSGQSGTTAKQGSSTNSKKR
jgi:hypothetical protein